MILKLARLSGKEESVKLLLLISLSVFPDDDLRRKMMEELVLELVEVVLAQIRSEVSEDRFSLSDGSSVFCECLTSGFEVFSDLSKLRSEQFTTLVLELLISLVEDSEFVKLVSELGKIVQGNDFTWLNMVDVALLEHNQTLVG